MELKIKPVVDNSTIERLNEQLEEHSKKEQKPIKGDKVEKATGIVESVKEELTFQQSLLKTYQQQYKAI